MYTVHAPILLDGGTGRELMRMGAPFRQPEWSALSLMESPESVGEVHRRYVAAGADVITTNSYAVVPFHIGTERFARVGADLAALSGKLARAAASAAARPVGVAGSLPPPCGSYRPDLFDVRTGRPILQRLIDALQPHVDLWLSETLSCEAEMQLVGELLAGSGKPWWVSFTLGDEPEAADRGRLRSGEVVASAAVHAAQLGAAAVLFNCCQPEVVGPALQEAQPALQAARFDKVQLGAYANAFAPQRRDAAANAELSALRSDLGPADYLSWACRWREHGADIIGGCCGVGPEHIAALRTGLN
jgi:S-methylmethionine-dependent homocysteine/selenocysteine methylase